MSESTESVHWMNRDEFANFLREMDMRSAQERTAHDFNCWCGDDEPTEEEAQAIEWIGEALFNNNDDDFRMGCNPFLPVDMSRCPTESQQERATMALIKLPRIGKYFFEKQDGLYRLITRKFRAKHVRELLKVYPEVLEREEAKKTDFTLLHFACCSGTDEIICCFFEILSEAATRAARRPSIKGRLIDLLFKERFDRGMPRVSLDVFKTVVDLEPTSIKMCFGGNLLITELLRYGYGIDFIKFGISALPQKAYTLRCVVERPAPVNATENEIPVGIEKVKLLCQVLTQFKIIVLDPAFFEDDGFEYLLKYLAENDLPELELLTFAIQWGVPQQLYVLGGSPQTGRSSSLAYNLFFKNGPGKMKNASHPCLADKSPQRTELQLSNLLLKASNPTRELWESVETVLQNSLGGTRPKGPWNRRQPQMYLGNECIDALAIQYSTMEASALVSCLDDISHQFKGIVQLFLTALKVGYIDDDTFHIFGTSAPRVDRTPEVVDVAAPLAMLVAHGVLESLVLEIDCDKYTCFGDFFSLFGMVEGPTRLKTLHVALPFGASTCKPEKLLNFMEEVNTSLGSVKIRNGEHVFTNSCPATRMFERQPPAIYDKAWAAKIDYYANLNRFGRGKVRGGALSRGEFVDLLAAVGAASWSSTGLAAFNTYFGLLLEAPGSWCEQASGAVYEHPRGLVRQSESGPPLNPGS